MPDITGPSEPGDPPLFGESIFEVMKKQQTTLDIVLNSFRTDTNIFSDRSRLLLRDLHDRFHGGDTRALAESDLLIKQISALAERVSYYAPAFLSPYGDSSAPQID